MEISIRKKFFSNYDPLFMLKLQYFTNKRNLWSLNLSYGGYSSADLLENHSFNIGLEYAHDFGKGLVMLVGSNYLNGFLWPNTVATQGAYFTIRKYFY